MNGAQEAPPVTTAGIGVCQCTVDDTSVKGNHAITCKMAYKDLSGAVTAAHLHEKAASGVILNTCDIKVNPITCTGDLSNAQYAQFLVGAYCNIHTGKNPGGEIRGDLVKGGPDGGLINLDASAPPDGSTTSEGGSTSSSSGTTSGSSSGTTSGSSSGTTSGSSSGGADAGGDNASGDGGDGGGCNVAPITAPDVLAGVGACVAVAGLLGARRRRKTKRE
jgi:hypothetical protein